MTQAQAENYFVYQAQAAGLPADGLHDAVRNGIKLGIEDVWYGHPWHFARDGYELTCSDDSNEYDLPDNSTGVMGAREKESQHGFRLIYRSKQDFDRIVPKPGYFSQNNPKFYTVFFDFVARKHRVSFFPIPTNGTVIYLDIRVKAPTSMDLVPPVAAPAVIAAAGKYVFPVGSGQWDAYSRRAYQAFLELQRREEPNIALPTVMLTGDAENYEVTRPWID